MNILNYERMLIGAKKWIMAYLTTNEDVLDIESINEIKQLITKIDDGIAQRKAVNLNHSITTNGKTFFTAQVVDIFEHTTYDMTVIFMERSSEESPKVINYYYGEPDMKLTAEYISDWLDGVENDTIIRTLDTTSVDYLCNLLGDQLDKNPTIEESNIITDLLVRFE